MEHDGEGDENEGTAVVSDQMQLKASVLNDPSQTQMNTTCLSLLYKLQKLRPNGNGEEFMELV